MPRGGKKKRLVLGDGDFGFAVGYVRKHPGSAANMIVTEYQSRRQLEQSFRRTFPSHAAELEDRNVEMQFSVDATDILGSLDTEEARFERIYFNCPHMGEGKNDYRDDSLRNMLRDFFQSAARVQEVGDRIEMALPKEGKDWRRHFRFGYIYKIYDAAVAAGYAPVKKRRFTSASDGFNRYAPYEHRITNQGSSASVADEQRQYIFLKTDLSAAEIRRQYPPHKYWTRKYGSLNSLMLGATSSGSTTADGELFLPELSTSSSASCPSDSGSSTPETADFHEDSPPSQECWSSLGCLSD